MTNLSENEHKFNALNNCGGGLKPCLYIDFSERFNFGWKKDVQKDRGRIRCLGGVSILLTVHTRRVLFAVIGEKEKVRRQFGTCT